jgi:hypothetical protein
MESRDIFLIVTLFIIVTVIAHIFASGCPPEEAPFVGGGEARRDGETGRGEARRDSEARRSEARRGSESRRSEAGRDEAGHSESNDITRYFVDAG